MRRSRATDDDFEDTTLAIPPSRMRTMMKSSPDVESVNSESVICLIKATEMFVKELVLNSHPKNTNEITYHDLSKLQGKFSRYSFLSDILPRKITAKEWTEKYKDLFLSS